MIALHIEGLNICAFDSKLLKVCMLNAAFNPKLVMPYHLQTLVAKRTAVDAHASLAPLPSLHGRIRLLPGVTTAAELDSGYVGWDLAGLTVRIAAEDGKGGPPTTVASAVEETATHPSPSHPDWSDLHWVIDINRFAPKATLRPDAQRLGARTTSIAEISGGRVRGGQPANREDSSFIWDFGNGVAQAVTDTLDYLSDQPLTVDLIDPAGTRRGRIRLRADGDAFLINEMTPGDAFLESTALGPKTVTQVRHAAAFFEALDNDKPIANPIKGKQFGGSGNIVEGAYCVVMRMSL